MRAHMAVRAKQGAGELTSGTMSPTLGVSIGFARLPVGVAPATRSRWTSAASGCPPWSASCHLSVTAKPSNTRKLEASRAPAGRLRARGAQSLSPSE